MPTIESTSLGPKSSLTWGEAISRIAGSVSGTRQADSLSAARDALTETLQDWDSRHDWRFEQVVADDIDITSSTDTFSLPSNFKKPYVAYLHSSKVPLWYVERANWHRAFPGATSRQTPKYYTLYNNDESGLGELYPPSSIADTLKVLYYRSMIYSDSDDAFLDIYSRWEGYVLHGAKALLTLGKVAGNKSDRYMALYEAGIKRAKEDDRRLPDQFLSFQPPSQLSQPYWLNPNSTWESVVG
jgi:hypothetical protein